MEISCIAIRVVVTTTTTIAQFTQNNFRSEKSNTKKNRLKILQRLYTGVWGIQPILFCLVIDKIGGNL